MNFNVYDPTFDTLKISNYIYCSVLNVYLKEHKCFIVHTFIYPSNRRIFDSQRIELTMRKKHKVLGGIVLFICNIILLLKFILGMVYSFIQSYIIVCPHQLFHLSFPPSIVCPHQPFHLSFSPSIVCPHYIIYIINSSPLLFTKYVFMVIKFGTIYYVFPPLTAKMHPRLQYRTLVATGIVLRDLP